MPRGGEEGGGGGQAAERWGRDRRDERVEGRHGVGAGQRGLPGALAAEGGIDWSRVGSGRGEVPAIVPFENFRVDTLRYRR